MSARGSQQTLDGDLAGCANHRLGDRGFDQLGQLLKGELRRTEGVMVCLAVHSRSEPKHRLGASADSHVAAKWFRNGVLALPPATFMERFRMLSIPQSSCAGAMLGELDAIDAHNSPGMRRGLPVPGICVHI
jgi:hypothetical protein